MLPYKKVLFILQQMSEKELEQPALFHHPFFGRTYEVTAFAEVKGDAEEKPVFALIGQNF